MITRPLFAGGTPIAAARLQWKPRASGSGSEISSTIASWRSLVNSSGLSWRIWRRTSYSRREAYSPGASLTFYS